MAKTLVKFLLVIVFCLTSNFGKGKEAFRFTVNLNNPRKYAVRFSKKTGLIEIKVLPAMSREFDTTKFYDPKLVNRVILTEIDSEVILGIELKEKNLFWYVSHQENPWRIIVDVWRSEPTNPIATSRDWEWQKPVSNLTENKTKGLKLSSLNKQENKVLKNTNIIDDSKLSTHKKNSIPIEYQRLLNKVVIEETKLNNLELKVGKAIGTESEWMTLKEYVKTAFDMGKDVSVLTRRLASLSEVKFKEDPDLLWMSGENAYLLEKFDLSRDYYRTLLLNHPKNPHAQTARLRLTDMEVISKNQNNELNENDIETYRNIALDDFALKYAKIAAVLRINLPIIDKNVQKLKYFLPIIDECVNINIVPIETRKNCFYVRTRFYIENMNIIDADSEVQKFMKYSNNDSRVENLNKLVNLSIRKLIENSEKNKDWESLINIEKKARPGIFDFTLNDSKLLKIRFKAFFETGNKREASNILSLYANSEDSIKEKTDSQIHSAKILYELNDRKRADSILNSIIKEMKKSEENIISQNSLVNLKTMSLAPFKSKSAFLILISEMKKNNYNENNFFSFLEYIKYSKNRNDIDWLYSKLISFPSKNIEETKKIESMSLIRADFLRDSNRLKESADMFFEVSKLNGGEKRSEAAYKAGLVYARIGILEKARESWQIAASDIKDKRYSQLASERLERMK